MSNPPTRFDWLTIFTHLSAEICSYKLGPDNCQSWWPQLNKNQAGPHKATNFTCKKLWRETDQVLMNHYSRPCWNASFWHESSGHVSLYNFMLTEGYIFKILSIVDGWPIIPKLSPVNYGQERWNHSPFDHNLKQSWFSFQQSRQENMTKYRISNTLDKYIRKPLWTKV